MNAMMMNSGSNNMGYNTVDSLLEGVSRQMASSNLVRLSRPVNTQRTGGSMRVVKPNSASNSPRGSMGMGRRRTLMDGPYQRRVTNQKQSPATFISNDGLQIPTRSNRPVSWHPSSQQASQQFYQPSYPTPMYNFNNQYHLVNLPPTPAAYAYSSPASSFSPESIPYTGYNQPQYSYQNTPAPCQPIQQSYTSNQNLMIHQQSQQYTPPAVLNMDPTMYSHFEWNNFATDGFESSTAPPTPENFLPIQHPEPSFPSEELIPYQPLSDEEDDGENLVGLGLYDTPEAAKSPAPDPQLDMYRSTMMTLGSSYRRPESTGKGLKLEETWTPPSDDEKEDGDEEEVDGDCEDEERDSSEPIIAQHIQQDHSVWL